MTATIKAFIIDILEKAAQTCREYQIIANKLKRNQRLSDDDMQIIISLMAVVCQTAMNQLGTTLKELDDLRQSYDRQWLQNLPPISDFLQ